MPQSPIPELYQPDGDSCGVFTKDTKVNATGLCHSVQACVPTLLDIVGLKGQYLDECRWQIYGINHQAWLVEITDKDGNDLYPEIKRRSLAKGCPKTDLVRRELMHTFGYYVTESSEHNAEYTPYFIKDLYPGLYRKYKVPINEYPQEGAAGRFATGERRRVCSTSPIW